MDLLWDALGRCAARFCPIEHVRNLVVPAETLIVNSRTYRVVKQLGEGGYAYVYLARELPTAQRPYVAGEPPAAIKKIIAASGERLQEARREVEVLGSLSHANCLPLLDSAFNAGGGGGAGGGAPGGRAYTVLLVFPAYEDGTLVDELERLAAAGRRMSTRHVLDIFRQVCAGVGHMHSRGFAHLDVKPHNVLVRRPRRAGGGALAAPAAHLMRTEGGGEEEEDDEGGGGGGDDQAGANGDLEAGRSLVARGYEAVVTDFGSARRLPIRVASRAEALAVQEAAEAHCTATYRPPELFDVPSHCTLGAALDVWSLGCTLYHLMYGASPFQQAVDQGASLALAVMNCRVPWPKPPAPRYPEELHSLVTACLQGDPAQRLSVPQLLERVDGLLAGPPLPDPAPPAKHGRR